MKFIILVGPPGAGKVTQAKLMQEKLGLRQVYSGDLFRILRKNETELGIIEQTSMDRGKL